MKNLVQKILNQAQTSWTAPAGVTQLTITVLDKFDQLAKAGQSDNSYFLKNTGAAFACGYNAFGSIGDGTIVNKSTPVPVSGGHSFISINPGDTVCTALKADGSAWTWGIGTGGQLGDNTVISKSIPTAVVGNHSFIMTNAALSCHALKADGSLWSWGQGTSGQLADGTSVNKSSPVPAVGGHSFINIAFNMALKANGSVWGWGANSNGQIGDGTTVLKSSPVAVIGGHSFISISNGTTHSQALKADGSVWTWGSNSFGQLGNELSDVGGSENQSSPVAVIGGHSFIQSVGGNVNNIALKADGSAWTWGVNTTGALGDNTTVPKSSPVPVIGGHSFIQVDACGNSMYALKADGTVWAWGSGGNGGLGDNTSISKSSPVQQVGNNLFEVGITFNNKRTFTVVPGTTYNLNGFFTQIGSLLMVSNAGNNLYIVLEYYA
jgi:alpha-tubulin suppressor-like RCC1 family protein